MTDWKWDTPTARAIESGVAAARHTRTYRIAVRSLRVAVAAYLLAALVVCARIREDPTVAVTIAGALLAVAIAATATGVRLARHAARAARPADVDGRRYWSGEVAVRLEQDCLALRRLRG